MRLCEAMQKGNFHAVRRTSVLIGASVACLIVLLGAFCTFPIKFASGHETHGKSQSLDDVFIFPDGGRKFDPELWQRDKAARFAMLFDLYHLPLNKATPEHLYGLLGTPSDTQKEFGGRQDFSAYYDLGLKNGIQTYLSVYFKGGGLECFSIQQRSEKGFPQKNHYPDWQLENLNWKSIAEEYNRNLFLVGMPVKLISLAVGYNPTESSSYKDNFKKGAASNDNVHCFGPFEFEYTPDNDKVARFRVAYRSDSGVDNYTGWENKDWRTDPRCLVRYSEYFNLKSKGEPFLKSFMPFSKQAWSGTIRDMGGINLRNALVADLVRTHALIGMSRNEVHSLLGKSSTEIFKEMVQKDPYARYEKRHSNEEQRTDPLCADTEEYQITASGCGNTGQNCFELAYRNDRVIGYRVIYVAGEGYGQTNIANGAPFSYFREP